MSISEVMSTIQMIIAHLVGGKFTAAGASTATTIPFDESWVGSFLGVFTTENGLFLIAILLGFCLFGIHLVKSLMNR